MNPKNITVIGAGLMGHGIALVMAKAGHKVIVTDPDSGARQNLFDNILLSMKSLGYTEIESRNVIDSISVKESLAVAVQDADVVFEAAPEKLELKQNIFSDIEKNAPKHCILASNTSVIQISKIMKGLNSRNRALGTHWWNPPHMIPLVEVIKTEWTEQKIAKDMMDLLNAADKTPVLVEKDVPGFIGNRLQHALWREAISLVENGVCDAEAVDTVIKSSFGKRLPVLGPLENADLVGVDLTLDIHENVLFDLDSRQGPSPYLKKLIAEGRLGMKTGEGFYSWEKGEAEIVRDKVSKYLMQQSEILKNTD